MHARRDGCARRAPFLTTHVALVACAFLFAPSARAVVEWAGRDAAYAIDARVDVRRAEIDEDVEFSLRVAAGDRASWGGTLSVRWPDSSEVRTISAPGSPWRINGRPVASRTVPGGLALAWPLLDGSSPAESLTVLVQGHVRLRILPAMRFRDRARHGVLLDEWFPTIATPRRDGAVDTAATRVARHRLRVTVPAGAGIVASGLAVPLLPGATAPPGTWHACAWEIDSVAMVTVIVSEGLAIDAGDRLVIAGVPAVRDPGTLRRAAYGAVQACSTLYGPPPVTPVSVVVVPHGLDADAATGPGVVILRGRGAPDGPARGALQHEVAHLWWGASMGARADVAWFFEGLASYSRELAAQCAAGSRLRVARGTLWERLDSGISVLGWRALVRSGGDRPLRGAAADARDPAAAVVAYGKSLAFCRAVGDSVGARAMAVMLRDLYARVRGRTMEEADVLAAVARAESTSGRVARATEWIAGRVAGPAHRSRARIALSPPRVDDAGNVVTGTSVATRAPSPARSAWLASAGVAVSSAGEIPGWTGRLARTWSSGLARVERSASTGRTEWTAAAAWRASAGAAGLPAVLVAAAATRRGDRAIPDAARAWESGRTDRLRVDARMGTTGNGASETVVSAHGDVIAPRGRAAGVAWSFLAAHGRALGPVHVALALGAQAVGGDPLVQDDADAFRLGFLRGRSPGRVPSRAVAAASAVVMPHVARPLYVYASIGRLHGAIDAHAGSLTPIARDPTIVEAGIGLSVGLVEPHPRVTVEAPLSMTGRLPGGRVRVQVAVGRSPGFPRTPLIVIR